MYNLEKETIMKVKNKFKRLNSIPVINDLIMEHRKFQEFLDLATASNNEVANIEPLIEVRSFNVECISKYTDLISGSALNILPLSIQNSFSLGPINQSELMWDINTHLSRLLPVYAKALKSKNLNSLTRMIIASNLEKILSVKDNLLHPISTADYIME